MTELPDYSVSRLQCRQVAVQASGRVAKRQIQQIAEFLSLPNSDESKANSNQ